MNNLSKKISRYGIIYLILVSAFSGLLILSAMLPHTRKFDSLMRRSAKILSMGGDYPEINGVTLDHSTDSLILNIAYSFDSKQPVRSAMESNYLVEKQKLSTAVLLDMTNAKKADYTKHSYGRYWFGQSAVMKILHYVWHLNKIYTLYGSLVLLLSFIAVLYAHKTAGSTGVFGLFIVLALCNFQVFFQSLQYPPVICIGLAGLIWMCSQTDSGCRGPVFFTLGMLTAYFDLLTAPVLSFGIPALFICGKDFSRLECREQKDWKNWFKIWCGYPAAWIAGYILSWGTKMLLGIGVSGDVQGVIGQIFLRVGTIRGTQKISRWEAVLENFRILYENTQLVLSVTVSVLALLLIAKIYDWKMRNLFFNRSLFFGYLMLALIPLAVIFLMANHTYIHSWMTYRGLALTFSALVMSLTAFQPKTEN